MDIITYLHVHLIQSYIRRYTGVCVFIILVTSIIFTILIRMYQYISMIRYSIHHIWYRKYQKKRGL
jgi:hypothetical protein